MSMEATAWTQLHNVMNAQADRRPFDRATLRRIAAFARPHRRRVALFLMLSVATALLAVATPVLAGRVVNAIVTGEDGGTVTRLSLLIAVIAVAEAALGLVSRWLSANLGEGLILDLRTAVFDHVQRMPIAFFTRTRTGALVSRLNNDVIGAQRAFSNTLSGVVSNVVTLLLTLGVMLSISWQITALALVLLPVFVLPARRMGTRMARLQREAAAHNAAMGTRMTERFSAPGATLIKLFGRPADESAEFAARAGRVRDIGVRTAMAQSAFITALTLVSALALALVYGLGGFYALRGQPGRGRGRLPGPAADPAVRAAHRPCRGARRGDERPRQLRAGLRGPRPQAAHRGEAGRTDGPGRAGVRGVRRRTLRLPVRRQGLPRLARGRRGPRHPRRQ